MAVLVAAAGYALAYALTPLLRVLPHELGHGLAALACGARPCPSSSGPTRDASAYVPERATGGVVRWAFRFLPLGGAWTFLTTALPIRVGRFFGPYAGRTSDVVRIREISTS